MRIHPMDNNLDQKRVSQIRRELEIYSTEQLTEIWRKHNLEEWTEEAFTAIHQILVTRPATQESAPIDIRLVGDHLDRAHQYAEAGRLQDALREIDLALLEDSNSLEAHQYRGHILEDLGDLDGAIQSYRKARYLDRSNESTRLNLHRALTKQFQQVTLKRQLSKDPENANNEEPNKNAENDL
jgi:Tfp pilus assembly protein PilF